MKMYYPEQLQRLYNTYKPGEDFRQEYQSHVPKTSIKSESAILIIENENEPPVIFHALRELVIKKDHRLLGIIANLLEAGRLSDADAIGLLRQEDIYFVSELITNQPNINNLRLLTGLLRDKDELLGVISNEIIYTLAKAELDLQVMKKYIGILINRKDERGVEFVMELFQSEHLLGGEVTELLGKNPMFSFQVLSHKSNTHADSVQLSELARLFPLEIGYVSVGMFIKTPAGWGEITAIMGKDGSDLKIAPQQQIYFYHLIFDSDSQSPIKAVIDVDNQQFELLDIEHVYRCGHCEFISLSQNYIIRFHTREMHPGTSPSLRNISTRIAIRSELQFSKSRPMQITQSNNQ